MLAGTEKRNDEDGPVGVDAGRGIRNGVFLNEKKRIDDDGGCSSPFFTVFTTSFGFFLCHGLMIWGALSMIEGIFHERLDRHFGGGSVDRWV